MKNVDFILTVLIKRLFLHKDHRVMMRKKTIAVIFYFVLMLLLTGCGANPDEPTDQSVQEGFKKHFEQYNQLLKKFREDKDVAELGVYYINAEHSDYTTCFSGDRWRTARCSLPAGRWEEYSSSMKQLEISGIEYEKKPDRYYFITFYEAYLMDARLRGIVYTEEKDPKFSEYYPKQEWFHIEGGWYSFLEIDG